MVYGPLYNSFIIFYQYQQNKVLISYPSFVRKVCKVRKVQWLAHSIPESRVVYVNSAFHSQTLEIKNTTALLLPKNFGVITKLKLKTPFLI